MKCKKIVKMSLLIFFCSFLLIWGGSLVKNRVLTLLHGDRIQGLNFAEPEAVPEYDWMRVISCSETEIRVYFVQDAGGYNVGGIAAYRCNPYGEWFYQEQVLWSTAGTADTLIWPYWHHIFYYVL